MKYVLQKHAYFRALNASDVAAILVNGTSVVVPAARMAEVLAFTEAKDLGNDAFIVSLAKSGLLVPFAEEKNDAALNDVLPLRWQNDAAWAPIGEALQQGKCAVIRDAFHADFAEKIYAELNAVDPWPISEDLAQESFSSRHHNIYNPLQLPPQTQHARHIFAAPKTKEFVAQQTGRNCAGPLSFSASCYFAEDYSLPHKDALGARTVAFVWHLAKNWDASWGGAFYWVPAASPVPASFNTLILFNVSEKSHHFVTQVNARASRKRLALNGWWQSDEKHPLTPSSDAPLPDVPCFFL